MAEPSVRPGSHRHLDATAGRDVVYCHGCNNEWYRDQSGIICPNCESEATEIVITPRSSHIQSFTDSAQISPENDPRPMPDEEIRGLDDHYPFQDSDPDEEDIEQYAHPHNDPFRRHDPFGPGPGNPDIMSNFQQMVTNMMGPGYRQGQAGRSGPEHLFGMPPGHLGDRNGADPQIRSSTFSHNGFTGMTAQYTFSSAPQAAARGPQALGADPFTGLAIPQSRDGDVTHRVHRLGPGALLINVRGPADGVASLLASLFSNMGPNGPHDPHNRGQGPEGFQVGGHGALPPMLSAILANVMNPANAVAGDAVYSQEALDRIISNLMEQHQTSNAPGPASPDAIAALPKKKVDEKMLGTEGKAECSVCMDDVALGDEVVALPCTHWFHEACASAWLNEHNTCPICRKGIGADGSAHTQASAQAQPPPGPPRRASSGLGRRSMHSMNSRQQERLDRISNAAGIGYASQPASNQSAASQHSGANPWANSPTSGSAPELNERPRRRYQMVGDPANANGPVQPPSMPNSAWDSPRRTSHSRGSSASTGSTGGTGFGNWFRRLGSNGGNGSGSGSGSGR